MMSPLFRIDFAPKRRNGRKGWVLFLVGCVLLAAGAHALSEKRNEVAATEERATQRDKTRADRRLQVRDLANDAVTRLVEPALLHPWARVFRNVEGVGGPGIRVVSVEHDAARNTTSLVVEVAYTAAGSEPPGDSAALGRATRGWATETIVSNSKTMRLVLRRRTEPGDFQSVRGRDR